MRQVELRYVEWYETADRFFRKPPKKVHCYLDGKFWVDVSNRPQDSLYAHSEKAEIAIERTGNKPKFVVERKRIPITGMPRIFRPRRLRQSVKRTLNEAK